MSFTRKDKATTTKELIEASLGVLIEALESGHSEVLTSYLSAMAKFHYYSFGNVLLIAMQKRDATRVAGIHAWNQLGRRVKQGEKGIMIFAPVVGKKRSSKAKGAEKHTDERSQEAQEREVGRLRFRPVYVWDVSQTEGRELPELGQVKGEVGGCLARLVNFTIRQGIRFGYSEKIAPARGVSYGGAIRILPTLSEAEQFSTLVHELAHEMLHKNERRTLTTKIVRETEAEAVAFVVSCATGLEVGSASSDYIQLYDGDAKLLKESLEVVYGTSAVILEAINPEPAKQEGAGEKSEAKVETEQRMPAVCVTSDPFETSVNS